MLAKPAVMLLGLINEERKGAYEITKMLVYMNIKWWFHISDSTVYITLKNLEKKEYIKGNVEKNGNMPERTVYCVTDTGKEEFLNSLREAILTLNYDTTVFSIAAFFIASFGKEEQAMLLEQRLLVLYRYVTGINERIQVVEQEDIKQFYVDNIIRMNDIVETEIKATKRLLSTIKREEQ